ncbi:putative E3 ubiquitin-protein ligase dtx2, partial [Lunasporangiospora selenospora]
MEEFSNHFKKFFEDSPPEIEQAPSLPILPPSTGVSKFELHPALIPTYYPEGPIKLLDLDPKTYPDLCSLAAKTFYGHARCWTDYDIKNIRMLRNPIVWKRYQAEKALRRQLAQQDLDIRVAEAKATGKPAGETVPSTELFRDEILFHGTPKLRVDSILMNGLDPRLTVRANYGKGVYFSDSIEKCMQYVDPQYSMNQEYSIVLCCTTRVAALMALHNGAGCKVSKTFGFEKSQILPLCVINFKATNSPSSFFRLSTHSVLFGSKLTYSHSTGDFLVNRTVPTPKDLNSTQSTTEWYDGDTDIIHMTTIAFGVPADSRPQVRSIRYPGRVVWALHLKDAAGVDHYVQCKADVMSSLLSTARSIHNRQEHIDLNALTKNGNHHIRKKKILDEYATIPNVQNLTQLLRTSMVELERIDQEGLATKAEVERIVQLAAQDAIQQGRDPRFMSHDVRLMIHPLEQRFKDLEVLYHQKKAEFQFWSEADIVRGRRVFQLQSELEKEIMEFAAQFTKEREAIAAQTREFQLTAKSSTSLTTMDEINRWAVEAAQEMRDAPQNKDHGVLEQFKMVNTELTMQTVQIWPQVVAELLLPTTMMNNISPMVFKDIVASAKFWPIYPRTRLPNQKLFWMSDYLAWILAEKERRLLQNSRSQHQSSASSNPSQPSGDDQVLTQDQWDHIDPMILKATHGLQSRFGTVIFNREARQKELDTMGQDMMKSLFVLAEPSMLLSGADKASTKASTESASSTNNQSSVDAPKSECPICQDILELPESTPGSEMDNPNTNKSDKNTSETKNGLEPVVKLKSCRHCFHEACITEWFKVKDSQLKCPMCNTMCGTGLRADAAKNSFQGKPIKLGPMPDGVLAYSFDPRLCCYFVYISTPAHSIPNPHATGSSSNTSSRSQRQTIAVQNDSRYAIIPFTARLGPLLLIRLITAYYYGHLFRNGTSITRNQDNVVVWNGIHLRTSFNGQHGYPAPNFEINCWQEIDQKGVAMGLDSLLISIPKEVP